MGGVSTVLMAATIDELKKKVEEWYAEAAGHGLDDERIPWDPDSAVQTEDGYEFAVWAHS